ncbi:OmpA family protein [Marinibacterium profundimaris]|uniref:OmpA family protein n=1 Tax=Marinibacterium profundimaris TaxID=1679460 RepID=UPI000B51FF12|nr:OmpA family protein [Marinibacterium profundimaris]
MRAKTVLISTVSLAAAAGLSLVAASFAVSAIEDGSEIGIRRALDEAMFDWAEVEANGLQVILTGTAPNEATRFEALSAAGSVVDSARVIDRMDVTPTAAIAPPRFSAEILRSETGISVIGLVPQAVDRDTLARRLERIAGPDKVAEFLETASYPVPEGWEDALAYAMLALEELPRAKISVSAGRVHVTATADSTEARARLERTLRRAAPSTLNVVLDITAPRPVITPFSLRYILDEDGAGRFDACSAPDDESADIILAAAREAGLEGDGSCTIGLGVPSQRWDEAAVLSLAALSRLGGGTLTMTDADIAMVAPMGLDPSQFDQIVGGLENDLPEVFALHATLPVPDETADTGPAEFIATLSPEGLVQLRGRVPSEGFRALTDSFARARFGSDTVHTSARVVEDLPADWSARVLAGLEALGLMVNGVVNVGPETITVRGVSHFEDASAQMSRLFTSKLGETASFELDIAYREPPPPTDVPLTADECEQRIADILTMGKITFEPGSARIDATSLEIVDAIAEVLDNCHSVPLEIQGYTDSQGRESMNLDLSQQRANAVLAELTARRIRTSSFRAKGYGEENPIADNGTEAGREANRRIEFRVIRTDASADDETTLDSMSAEGGDADSDTDSGAEADSEADAADDTGDNPGDASEEDANDEAPEETESEQD